MQYTESTDTLNQITLFEEDFAAMPIGTIAGDYSPAGEYHVIPALSETGRWRETVLHYNFSRISRGNWQVVQEADGAHVLEQTTSADQPAWQQPILVAGDMLWRDVTMEAQIQPWTQSGWRAIIFRYQHGRRFYAAVFTDGRLQVVRRDNDDDIILAQTDCTLDPDSYTHVQITCEGASICVSIDNQEPLRCDDETPDSFFEGCIGFGADHVTRFCDVRVSCAASTCKSIVTQEAEYSARLSSLRKRHPQPKLWRRIKTPQWGTDRNLRVGDINGDGQPEIVLAQRTERLGGGNFASISSVAAYDLQGNLLWTIGEPSLNRSHVTSDLCFQIHNLYGNGQADIFFCKDWHFYIADGATGQIKQSIQLPREPSHEPGRFHRAFGDSIYFCDLAGSGCDDSILIKDRYRNVWAYDRDLRLLWHFSGNLGHYPFARDIDNDGKDEVMIGHHLLDHDGACLWTAQYKDHADNVALLDLHDAKNGDDSATRVVMAGSDAGFIILDLDGRELLHYPIGHAQSMCFANLLPKRDGLEIMVNTFWGAAGITAVFSEAGRLLHQYEPMPYAALLQPVNWVPFYGDGAPADLVLLSTHTRQGGLIDGEGRRAVMFPEDNHPVLCSDARDLDGDGIDEVLTWDEEEIWIYKADVGGREPANYPQRNPWYNDSNYRAQISLPFQFQGDVRN